MRPPPPHPLGGNVSDLHFMGLAPQAKFVPIDEQPDHNVMHLNRLRETDRLAHQPFDSGTPCGMLALDLLCISFARLVLIGGDMARIRAPA